MADISDRKADHVRLAATDREAAGPPTSQPGAGFADVRLVHVALPELDLAHVDPSAEFLGRRLSLPLCIASMTGGHAVGATINAVLARAAERHGLAMGVGSQRAALRDPSLRDSYSIARREAPGALLLANVGAPQLVTQDGQPPLTPADVLALAEMIEADAVVVHLNALQEIIQPEGDRNAEGWTDAIGRLVARLPIPVVAKETGGGISAVVARRLAQAGVAAIDVGGRGGTSFARIEGARAAEHGDPRGVALGEALAGWGIPTAASVVLASVAGVPIVATGGVRTGVDAAKAVALGATLVGVARPLLQAALDGGDMALDAWIEQFRHELVAAQFLTASPTLADLATAPRVIGGEMRRWLDDLAE